MLTTIVVLAAPAQAAVGIRISNGRLVEGNGSSLVLRGINHAHTWYKTQTSSFANIKATGANSVRVVLSGGRWQPADTAADVTNVINLCKQNRLICVLENHDTTGFNEQSGAVSLDASVNYWISIQSALTGQENYVILNIGNEPYGNGSSVTSWPTDTANAIRRLRSAGFQHTIMVDAPNWGQDWQFIMRDNAPTVAAADTTGNTIFSIHMYGVFDTAAEVNSYVDSFTSRGLPLCICEFGNMHSDGDPNEDAIMSKARTANIGMMGWSWSGNGGGVEYLDMVTGFNPAQRSAWGTRYIAGTDGVSSTSREASVYSGQTQPPPTTTRPPTSAPPTTRPPTSVPPTTSRPPTTGACGAAGTVQTQWGGGYVVQPVTVTAGSSAINGWTVTFTLPSGHAITGSWNATLTINGSTVTAKPMSYNANLGAGQSTSFGFQATRPASNTSVPSGYACTSP
jgi:mannan endo-1,4-beta-mannosidase